MTGDFSPLIGEYVSYIQQARVQCEDPAVFGRVVCDLLREFADLITEEEA